MTERKLTKREQAAVLRAAELVENGKWAWSCWALNRVTSGCVVISSDLTRRYAEFFGQGGRTEWEVDDGTKLSTLADAHEIRVLCLLFFLEANR